MFLSIYLSFFHARLTIHPQVHRDLKPGNILIDARGRAAISDFGLARIKNASASGLSTTNVNVGTVVYMAPECFSVLWESSVQPLTEAVDVYAFAIVLWEMLSGHKPWAAAPTHLAVVLSVYQHGLRPPMPPEGRCPGPLAQLIHQCWAQDPKARPSAKEVLVRLRSMLINGM